MNEVLLFPLGGAAAGQGGQDISSLQLLSLPCQRQGTEVVERAAMKTGGAVTSSHKASFVCTVCQKPFNHKGNFLKHYRTHTGEKPFQCPKCPYKATQKAHLTSHMLGRHGEVIQGNTNSRSHEKMGQLVVVGQPGLSVSSEVASVSSLPLGPRVAPHEAPAARDTLGPTIYHCPAVPGDIGDLEGFTSAKLASHTKNVCPYCNKRFYCNAHFIRHQRIHTGEKPYKCPHCDYSSTQKGNLKGHIGKRHGL
ncbi:hypothetical protein Pcinc_025004 [Petrolisthes cinctipes]|uniref:C2H2-type domain-containing protein n=1 Tax=Petrolisthes cinctipes TaxID=88211 RepID=A0AAE1F9M2_PETCI|nr:hypothetical protein Pcinc_025004 [Petrolisthes cinctipes]